MAISVKDIREKEFSRTKHGYDMNEVDDFLDEIAEQLTAVIQENLSLVEKVNAKPETVVVEKPVEAPKSADPAYDESSYFKNLESTLRETLISGQRIADDTVNKAQREADELLAKAREEAEAITAKAHAEAEALTGEAIKKAADAEAQVEAMKTALNTYKAQIRDMIAAQQKLIEE